MAASERPNFLVFMTDQEQAAVLQPDHPCLTPNAARFAAQSVNFRRAYCPAPHCCPSRATFMTGQYPSRHGVHNNVSNSSALSRGLAPGVRLFSELLEESGYRLLFSGKWHVSDLEDPADRGWEQLCVSAGAGSRPARTLAQWGELGADDRPRGPGQITRPGWPPYSLYGTGEEPARRDRQAVAAASDAIDRLAQSSTPWFLFVGPTGPHDPYIVPPEYLERYRGVEVPLPPSFADRMDDKPGLYRRMRQQHWDQLSELEHQNAIRHYWAYCTLEDELFGEVLDRLQASGQAERTVVVRLSDHGDYCGAHGLYLKGVPAFTEAYRVPAMIRWPGAPVEPGAGVEACVTLADFAPTFLELAGLTPPPMTGRSLVPWLRGEVPADWDDTLYTQLNGVELYYSQRIVMDASFKYVYNGFDADELYDLRSDPHEIQNRAADPAYRDVKRELVGRMWRFAAREQDGRIFNAYPTVSLAPFGPGDAL